MERRLSGCRPSVDLHAYHSLIVAEKGLPKELEVTAGQRPANSAGTDDYGALRHRTLKVRACSFIRRAC